MEKIIITQFNHLNWHDAIIEKIVVDRAHPGTNDSVELNITWPDETRSKLCFHQVYWLNMSMNFGVVASESILRAVAKTKECSEVNALYAAWQGMIDDVDLNYYEIETNSTNSKIRIIAEAQNVFTTL